MAATKTFSSELVALAYLASLWKGEKGLLRQLSGLPAKMVDVLRQTEEASENLAKKMKALNACVVIGRGFQMGIAHEMGLKMKECAGVPALSYSTADFAHGPVSLARNAFPVFLVSAPGRLAKESFALTQDYLKRGAKVYRVGLKDSSFANLKSQKGLDASLCATLGVEELFSPLLTILPAQWFAYHLALAKGLNPAMPQGLKKVTKTK